MASPVDGPIELGVPETHRKSRLRMLGILLLVIWAALEWLKGWVTAGITFEGVEDIANLPDGEARTPEQAAGEPDVNETVRLETGTVRNGDHHAA